MRFIELIVEDFGVYEGATTFHFAPRRNEKNGQPITIVHGPNGSGKSTLFKSLNLALFGKIALGDRVTQKQYDDYILNRLHKTKDGTPSGEKARLSLTLELTLSGVNRILSLERVWVRSKGALQESFQVLLDGTPPYVRNTDHQDWINSLIHPGTVQSVFFDAEQLDNFADPNRHDEQLRNTLDRLLGLDLISRLQSDIITFLLNDAEGQTLKKLKTEYRSISENLATLHKQKEKCHISLEELRTLRAKEVAALEAQERRFIEKGGNYAVRRKEIELEISKITETMKKHRADIRNLCSELFPLALAPGITGRFLQRLQREKAFKKARHAQDSLLERRDAIMNRIFSAPEWQQFGITTPEKNERLDFLLRILREEMDVALDHEPLVHDISDSEFRLYSSWIEKASTEDTPLLVDLCKKLRECEEESEALRADLERAPDESAVQQQQHEIEKIREHILGFDVRIGAFEEELQKNLERIEKEEQRQNSIVNSLGAFFAQEKRTDLAQRAQGALGTYKELLRRRKLQQLEEAFIRTFNRICRKDRFIKGITINPDDFSTKIEDIDGSILALDQLSAAERQLYVYSLIGGIHEASGLPLPLVIDTPLARFDTTHRSRLVKDFFPHVSKQVILFATDEEEEAFREHGGDRWTGVSYRLTFDDQAARTTAISMLDRQEAM